MRAARYVFAVPLVFVAQACTELSRVLLEIAAWVLDIDVSEGEN